MAGLVFFNIPEGPAAAYQRGCVMFFTLLLFELLPFCYVSFYSWDRKFFLADRESGIYSTSAYYVAHTCASEPCLNAPGCCSTMLCTRAEVRLCLHHVSCMSVHDVISLLLTPLQDEDLRVQMWDALWGRDGAFIRYSREHR